MLGTDCRMRVLIVDDSSATRTFIRECLEASVSGDEEIEVTEADGGLEALRLLPRGPYGLVITDINMGGINGLELLKFIRDQPQYASTKVLLISTLSSQKDRQRGLDLGADAFLAKPFTAEELRASTKALTGKDLRG